MAAKSQVTPDMTQTCLAITNLYSQSQGFSAADRNGAQRPFTHSRLKGFFNATGIVPVEARNGSSVSLALEDPRGAPDTCKIIG